MILSVSSIYASELDDDSLSNLAIDECEALSVDECDDLVNDEGDIGLDDSTSEDDSSVGDFDELLLKINNTPEGGVLVLDKDYKYVNGSNGGSYKGIIISKPITIDGNGHSIDGNGNERFVNNSSRIFNITADNVILKNINFINGNALGRYDNIDAGGGAIYWYGNNGTVMDCNFSNNTGYGIEDDPYDKEEVIITEDGMEIHTIRMRPMGAKVNEGGAIVWRGNDGTVSNCIFHNNIVGYPDSGGAICWRGDNGRILNSTFYQNSAWCGGAVTWIGNNGKILFSKFFDNGMFNGDIFWFGLNGLIKNSILLKSDGRAVVFVYDGSLNANDNFWGDTLSNPNGTLKLDNLSTWYILNRNVTNPTLFNDNELLVDFDDFLLVNKNGNLYNNESQYLAKINLNPNPKLISKNLTKYYKSSTQFKVKVYGPYGKLAVGKYVTFKINKKTYKVKTDKNGIATLKINQKPGKYNVSVQYGNAKANNVIRVKTTLITKNIVKKVKKLGKYNIKVLNGKGKPYAKRTVKIRFRGKTYSIKTKKNGIARFSLPKSLKKGKYTIKVSYNGLTNTNKITVKR